MWPPRLRLCERYRIEDRHCEEPTGRANARPMTGSATKQSIVTVALAVDCFASLAMTVSVALLLTMTTNINSHSRARYARGFARTVRPEKIEGAGNAGRAMRPRPRMQ